MLITVEQRVAATPARMTARAREVAAMFGLLPASNGGGGSEDARTLAIVPRTEIDLPVPGPGVTLITGPSGSGKSTLLRLIAAECTQRGVRVQKMPVNDERTHADEEDLAIIDLVAPERPLSEALELLSLAGLGDAFVMLRRTRELSDGQRVRFHIARMMAAARIADTGDSAATATLIAIDEFAATLDRITARNLARNLRRWSDRSGVAIVLATTHEDLADALAPDVLIRKALDGSVSISRSTPTGTAAVAMSTTCDHDGDEFRIETGTLDDYRALAAFHYRSHHPGAATSVLRLMMHGQAEPLLAGVLVRSLPHLNCAAREFALRDRYATLTPHERGIAVNREIRCISRVIIDPRFRGRGLAVRMVRFALEHPEHDSILYTEALAAMGRVSPFFERAGMRRFDLPEACRPAHARWRDALTSAGLTAPDLMRDDGSLAVDGIVAEARRFLRATRCVSRQQIKSMRDRDLLTAAGARLLSQPVYYLFAHQPRCVSVALAVNENKFRENCHTQGSVDAAPAPPPPHHDRDSCSSR